MTITFNRNSRTFTLAHSGNTRTATENELLFVAMKNEWGDVEAHIEAAKQNPGISITVDNTPRVPRPRNSRVYSVVL